MSKEREEIEDRVDQLLRKPVGMPSSTLREQVIKTSKTTMVKVLLPDDGWNGKADYTGHMEGVWVAITAGTEENGEGILVNIPMMPSYNAIGMGDLVQYKELDPNMKPIIVKQLASAERKPGRF